MAHYALHKLHIRPSELNEMPTREKAIVYGSILAKLESDKKEQEKLKQIKARANKKKRR